MHIVLTVQFEVASDSVAEGTEAAIIVFLSTSADREVSVDFTTESDTAIAPDDYTSVTRNIIFSAGETSVTVLVDTIDDNIREVDEVFRASLSNPTNGLSLGTPITTEITIVDNDRKYYVAIHIVLL